jgi:hypothetical protein
MNLRKTRAGRACALAGMAMVATLASSGIAYADNIQDNIVDTGDGVTLEAGSDTGGTATVRVVGNNADGTTTDTGCNWDTGESPLVLDMVTPSGVTATPDPLSITACGVDHTVTFKASASAVSGTATVSITSTPAGGGGYANQVSIPITVTKTNTRPTVSVEGITDGSTYDKGAVPAATCSVTDAEDGPKSFAATLSAITGPNSADGIGSQTASCSYTDAGGLTASDSATYSIGDPSAPVISYTLDPVSPDGLANWYRGTVILDWTVTETQSPGSLSLTGCQDQNITADQVATEYSCSATSAGGSSGPVKVTVKRDGNGPAVSYTSASGTAGHDGWYTSPVTATFTATDGFSGPASQTATNVSTSDGSAVTIPSPAFTDNAGNTTAAAATSSPAFKIDTVAPEVGAAVLSGTEGSNGWYRSAVTASFTATDATSGVAGTNPQTVTSSQQGTGIVLSSPAFSDVAGNTTAAGNRSATVKVDSIAPSVNLQGAPTDGTSYYFGSVPTAPTCGASDTTPGSGLADADAGDAGMQDCAVTGGGTSVGPHTWTATATDNAGNTSTDIVHYTVLAWTVNGFYAPIDKGVHNTVKGGATVPLKFELFAGTSELTDVSAVAFSTQKVSCDPSLSTDGVEVTSSTGTNLRYDATGGQFIQNWKTPTAVGNCYKATMTAADGSAISALFKIK